MYVQDNKVTIRRTIIEDAVTILGKIKVSWLRNTTKKDGYRGFHQRRIYTKRHRSKYFR